MTKHGNLLSQLIPQYYCLKTVGKETAKQYEILIYSCDKNVKCEWSLFVIVDISKIDEDLPQVLDTQNTTSKSSPIKSKPEMDNPTPSGSGSDGNSQPSEPNSDTQTDSSSAAAAGSTEQKSEETPAESKPETEPQPEALTAET